MMASRHRQHRPASRPVQIAAVALFSAFVVLFDGFLLASVRDEVMALRWTTTSGVVTASTLVRGHGKGTTWRAEIKYEYSVKQAAHSGDTYRLRAYGSSGRRHHENVVRQYPVGASVRVWYDPTDPRSSTLEPGLHPNHLCWIMFLLPFNAVMICMWLWVGRDEDRPTDQDDAFAAVIRTRRGRLTLFLFVVAAAGFLLAVVQCIAFGFHPPWVVAIGAWVALPLISWMWWRKIGVEQTSQSVGTVLDG